VLIVLRYSLSVMQRACWPTRRYSCVFVVALWCPGARRADVRPLGRFASVPTPACGSIIVTMANPNPSPNGAQPSYVWDYAPRHALAAASGRTLAEIAKDATHDAVSVLRAIVNDVNERSAVRTRAAAVLLAMGWGAAPKAVNLNVVTDGARSQELSEADIVALAFRGSLAAPQSSDVLDVEVLPASASYDGGRAASGLRVVGEGGSDGGRTSSNEDGTASVRELVAGDGTEFDLDEFLRERAPE
jgi:hypothetical protein